MLQRAGGNQRRPLDTVAKTPVTFERVVLGAEPRSKWEQKNVEGEKAEAAGVHPALEEFGGEQNE